MASLIDPAEESWRTKPTDRFVLKWIKLNLSAPLTLRLAGVGSLEPWMITAASAFLGVCAGFIFAAGWGLTAGLVAAASQVLDGVDGQLARLTGRAGRAGAFLDSVLDRYADGFLVIGLIAFNGRMDMPIWLLVAVGGAALVGGGLISYSSARAENLGIGLGGPTLASKGTRTTIAALSGILSPFVPYAPAAALAYLAVHTNVVVLYRIGLAYGARAGEE
jgi:phosphatidylglycerophosphate synthase